MTACRKSQRGAALLMVLWLSAALAAVGLSVATMVRTEVEHTSTMGDGLRTQYLASGSVDRFIQWMAWGDQRKPDGTPRFWQRRQTLYPMSYPTGEALVQTIPETAKLNVNLVSPQELQTVIAYITGDPARARGITEAIVDWRGRTPDPLDAYYSTLGPTFQPRHASLQEIEELMFVRGMTPELFYGSYTEDAQGRLYARGGLRDCLSIWGSYLVDVNGAEPAVLAAIGIAPGHIDSILRRRVAKPFETMREVQELGIPPNRLSVNQSSIWTIRATARLRNQDGSLSDVVRSSSATVKYWTDDKPHASMLQVLRYFQDAWSESMIRPGLINPGVRP